MSPEQRVTVTVGDRQLELSNLDKPLFPSGFTKGDMLDYYARIAPVMLPHLKGRPVTVKRYPNAVDRPGFIEKNVPRHAPPWIATLTLPRKGTDRWGKHQVDDNGRTTTTFAVVDDLPTLMWLVNLAAVEFHTPMWRAGRDGRARAPDLLVFDLDPGPPATISECCRVALRLRERAAHDHVDLVAKTSGSKGLQLYASVAAKRWSAERTNQYAHGLARQLEAEDGELVVSRMAKPLRQGRVFIDWSQNNPAKTTVSPYSLRALDGPPVSTPVTWEEVETATQDTDGRLLALRPDDVLGRIDALGDLFASLD